MPKIMRKPTHPRLAQDEAEPTAVLDRLHALARTMGLASSGHPACETIAFLAAHLEAGEVCLARHAHSLLRAQVAEGLEHYGYVDRDDAALLEALKEFAEREEWAFRDGAWRRCSTPMAAGVAHA